ncbi:MAG: RNA 2',3'-cyclic phosphodiesterase [Promethearchaeota archaeon]|jgi:2'-5' RNA ligase
MIRSFIALELKENTTIENITSFSSRLKKNQPNLKLVKPENLHMTVKFLGNISESLAPKIYQILKTEINEKLFHGKEFKYYLKGVGQFNKFTVLWVKLVGDISFLQTIKDSVEDLLNLRLKVDRDRRTQFKPHLTIGRLRKEKINYKTFDIFKKLISENKSMEFGAFKISQIKLKKSDLTPKGPIYSDLEY